jgi:biotin-(acetyl-CoA carboxylase) ligase
MVIGSAVVLLASFSIFLLGGSAGRFAGASPLSASKDGDDGSKTCKKEIAKGGADSSSGGSATSTSRDLLADGNVDKMMTVEYHPDDRRFLVYHFESTTSTQDEAKLLAEALPSDPKRDNNNDENSNIVSTFCVTAVEQTSGRGTSGRQWLGVPGNVFVTIGVPQSTWISHLPNVPLTLLPLKVGELTARTVQRLLDECRMETDTNVNSNDYHSYSTTHEHEPFVTVKWPNDVLCDHKKISGTLIESSAGWFLIGIGINLQYAPEVPTSGANHGRPSVSVRDYCPVSKAEIDENLIKHKARQVGVQLAYDLHTWLNDDITLASEEADNILIRWKEWLDWDMDLVIRDTLGREKVRLLDVLPDGRVQVQNVNDGTIRVLVSDYFL